MIYAVIPSYSKGCHSNSDGFYSGKGREKVNTFVYIANLRTYK